MRKLFRRLPLPFKLVFIGLVPLLFLVYLTITVFIEKKQKLSLLEGYIQRIGLSANLSRLIDHLQYERQYSFDYVLKKKERQKMLDHRQHADSLIHLLETNSDSALKNFPSYSLLHNLRQTRNGIDSGTVNASGVLHFYSAAIFRLNTLNGLMPGSDVYLKKVYSEMVTQKLLSEMVTYLGIINANIYHILLNRQYVVETLLGTYGSYEVFQSYEKEFRQKASTGFLQSFNLIEEKGLEEITNYLEKVFKNLQVDSTYDPDSWSRLSSSSLEDLRSLQLQLLQNAEKEIQFIYNREVSYRNRALFFLVLSLLLLIAIVIYSLHSIGSTLNELSQASLRIAEGETGTNFKNMPRDVIGSLAGNITKIGTNHKLLADAANRIGQGEFNQEVPVRGQNDILGNALVQMQENLRRSVRETEKSREEFRQLADLMPQIVWTALADGYTDYYNKRWYEYTGEERIFGDASFSRVVHPEDLHRCMQTWKHSVNTGQAYEIEYRFRDRNGTYRWFLGRAIPIRDESGQIIKWFGTSTDIHDQKEVNKKLESLVKERTGELERSNDDLQQFAHVASHDLKEPLRKIRVFSNRLKEEYHSALPEKAGEFVDKIQQAAQRMSAMIEGILHYSQAEQQDLQFQDIDLNGVIHEIRQDLELIIQQKNAVITDEPLPVIRGIPVLIYQLFYNLLHNALKFSKEDGGNIITIRKQHLNGSELNGFASLQRNRNMVAIEIRDTGIGFDPSQSDRLFQMFTRLNSRERFEGTGLGLALCKKIVARHHGMILAKGAENEGASFTVVMPVEEPRENGPETAAEAK